LDGDWKVSPNILWNPPFEGPLPGPFKVEAIQNKPFWGIGYLAVGPKVFGRGLIPPQFNPLVTGTPWDRFSQKGFLTGLEDHPF